MRFGGGVIPVFDGLLQCLKQFGDEGFGHEIMVGYLSSLHNSTG